MRGKYFALLFGVSLAGVALAAPTASLDQELARLFKSAGRHATSSRACVDGMGRVTTIGKIAIAEQRADAVVVTYEVTVQQEGDTRRCSRQPEGCPWRTPVVTSQRATLVIETRDGKRYLAIPKSLPGLEAMGPLDKTWSTGCYGGVGKFVPAELK